jgi:putative drug exporter of the RND superfamily
MLERLGKNASRHHWAVIGVWVLIVVILGVVAKGQDGQTHDVFTIPGTQSQKALDVLARQFPAANDASAQVVFVSKGAPLTAPASAAAIGETVARLEKLPGVKAVTNPTSPLFASALSADKKIGFSTVAFDGDVTKVPAGTFVALQHAAAPANAAGLQVRFGGPVVDYLNQPTSAISNHADEIGLAIAVVILLLALGSAVSMSVPIVLALFALTCSSLILKILEAHMTIGQVAPVLGTMIGLGVGIDYSLFIVSRHRQNLDAGLDVDGAAGRAIATSGSAVLFAAMTVCIALCGLALLRIPYVTTLGFSAALFVAVTVLAALTLLPAMLGAIGHHIGSWSIRHHRSTEAKETMSRRWAGEVARRPIIFCVVSLTILLLAAAPILRMDLGFTSDASAPTWTTQRQAYDLITQGFGPGANGPLLAVVSLPRSPKTDPAVQSALDHLSTELGATAGVAKASPALLNPAGTVAIIGITPKTDPNAPATTALVHRLRNEVIPGATATGALAEHDVVVGGTTAASIDLTTLIQARLFPFIGGVILLAFLLLMMVFRSVFVPLSAAVMNILSIGAAYGVVIVIFQWGWGKGLIGLQETVPIVSFVPVMMFAILFGLSMDYEVFLLSRIREDYDRTGDPHSSVTNGLGATAKVITAAALIMISVFLSFVTNPSPIVKMIGLGMAAAVLIDATVVRMMLVPATMELAGKLNWWCPAWLDRIMPHIHIDPPPAKTDEPATPSTTAPEVKEPVGV